MLHADKLGRDRISNGRCLPASVDLRSAYGRRFRYLLAEYTREAGGTLTESEKGMVRQTVALQMRAEKLQEQIALGQDVDPDTLIRLAGTARRNLEMIRAKAAARTQAKPDLLGAYLARKAAESAPDDDMPDDADAEGA